MERTLVLVKDDGVQRGLIGETISFFEKKGLKIVALRMVQPSRALVERHYADHSDKPFFTGLVESMAEKTVVAMVLEGVNAVEVVRRMIGAVPGGKAGSAPLGSLRGDLGMSMVRNNLVHASDSVENAAEEAALWFDVGEILNYRRLIDLAIYSPEELDKEER